MVLKVVLAQMLESMEGVEALAQCKYPAKISWDLAKVVRRMKEHQLQFHDMRSKLMQQYGERNEKEGTISITPGSEGHKIFVDEMFQLMQQEIEIDVKPFDSDVLLNDKISIEPKHLVCIDWLFGVSPVTHLISEKSSTPEAINVIGGSNQPIAVNASADANITA